MAHLRGYQGEVEIQRPKTRRHGLERCVRFEHIYEHEVIHANPDHAGRVMLG